MSVNNQGLPRSAVLILKEYMTPHPTRRNLKLITEYLAEPSKGILF